MPSLTVSRQYLLKLAAQQDTAAGQADTAKVATSKTGDKIRKTHGEYSAASNNAVSDAAKARANAASALSQACTDLGIALRKAAAMYQGTDDQSRDIIDNEMRDR